MNNYEAMFIFPETLKENVLEESVTHAKAEIKKLGGEVDSTTRLGKRAFSRVMKKQQAGFYVLVTFKMAGDNVRPLLARYKLSEDVFRVQVVKAPVKSRKAMKKIEEGKKDGDAK